MLLTRKQVCQRLSIGLSTLRKLRISDPAFPKPRILSRTMLRWVDSDIDAYLKELPPSSQNN